MSVGNSKNVTPYSLKNNEFNYVLSRQHSLPAIQVNQQHHYHLVPVYQQRLNYGNIYQESVAMASHRTRHAAMEIYRPPNIRSEAFSNSKKLNVHAKEFVMGSSKQSSGRSNFSDGIYTPPNYLLRDVADSKPNPSHNSKSNFHKQNSHSNTVNVSNKQNGNSNHQPNTGSFSNKQNINSTVANTNNFNLQRAKSSGNMIADSNIVINPQRVHFKTQIVSDKSDTKISKSTSPKERKSLPSADQPIKTGILKRSKSLSAADALKFMEMEASFSACSVSFSEYHLFPKESHAVMKQAVQDVNRLTDKQKMTLARYVIEHVLRDKKFSSPVAKLSIIVMEKDNNGTYLDSLLNTCQMFYQKKETCLLKNPTKLILFVTFLAEMYTELKHSKLQLKFQSDPITPPKQVLLLLISRCCEDILTRNSTHSLSEMECVFQALTSVGRDLEVELPERLILLYDKIKEVFLKSSDGPEVKKTMLQLIELRAANWQLPVSALNFYYPKSSN